MLFPRLDPPRASHATQADADVIRFGRVREYTHSYGQTDWTIPPVYKEKRERGQAAPTRKFSVPLEEVEVGRGRGGRGLKMVVPQKILTTPC